MSDTDCGERKTIYINFATRCRKVSGIKFCSKNLRHKGVSPAFPYRTGAVQA